MPSSSASSATPTSLSPPTPTSLFARAWHFQLRAPPDGGVVGGLVIFATFLVYAIIVGLESVFGLLMAAMLEEDGTPFTREGLSWAQSAAIFLELALGGPVGNAVERFGARAVCFVGAVLISLGMFLASSATTEGGFALAYSAVAGTGFSLSYVSASIAVSQYFVTRTAFANAISGIGMGVGTIALSTVMEVTIRESGWRACMRILAVMAAVCVGLASFAYVPIESLEKQHHDHHHHHRNRRSKGQRTLDVHEGSAGRGGGGAGGGEGTGAPEAGAAEDDDPWKAPGLSLGNRADDSLASPAVNGSALEGADDEGDATRGGQSLSAASAAGAKAAAAAAAASARPGAPAVGSPLTALKVLSGRAQQHAESGTGLNSDRPLTHSALHGGGGGGGGGVGGATPSPLRISAGMGRPPSHASLDTMAARDSSLSGLTSSAATSSPLGPAGQGQAQQAQQRQRAQAPLQLQLQQAGPPPRIRAGTGSRGVSGGPTSPWAIALASPAAQGPSLSSSLSSSSTTTPTSAGVGGGAARAAAGVADEEPGATADDRRIQTMHSVRTYRGAPGSALLRGSVGMAAALEGLPALDGGREGGASPSVGADFGTATAAATLARAPGTSSGARTPSPAGPASRSPPFSAPSLGGGGTGGDASIHSGGGGGGGGGGVMAPHLAVDVSTAAAMHAGGGAPNGASPAGSSSGRKGLRGADNQRPHLPHLPHLPRPSFQSTSAVRRTTPGSVGFLGGAAAAFTTPPISPWLLAGGQASAGSIVPHMSLKHSALASLVRELQRDQQQIQRSSPQMRATAGGGEGMVHLPGASSSSMDGAPDAASGAGRRAAQLPDIVEEERVCDEGKGEGEDAGGDDDEVPPVLVPGPGCGAFARVLHRLRLIPSRPDGLPAASPASRVWLDGRFWSIALAMALIISTMTVPETHLAPFVAGDMGLGASEASRLFAVMGVAGIVGRLAFGALTLFYHVDLQFMLQTCGVATGLAMAGLAVYGDSPAFLTLFAIVFGGVGTATYGFVSPILVDYFGLEGLPFALGGTYTVRAPAVLLFSPVAGWIRETTGSYKGVFFVCGVLCVVSALPIGVMTCRCARHQLHAAVQEAAAAEAESTAAAAARAGRGGQGESPFSVSSSESEPPSGNAAAAAEAAGGETV